MVSEGAYILKLQGPVSRACHSAVLLLFCWSGSVSCRVKSSTDDQGVRCANRQV